MSTLGVTVCQAQTLTKISDAKKDSTDGNAYYLGRPVNFKGIVSTYELGDGKGNEFMFYDGTGAMCVYSKNGTYTMPIMGDSIIVHGIVGFYNGQTEIENDTITYISSGNPVIAPVVMTGNLTEANEDMIVEYKNMVLEPGAAWGGSAKYPYFSAIAISTNNSDTIEIYLESMDSCYNLTSPGTDTFNIIGAVEQYKKTSPYLGSGVNGGYEVVPRRVEDIHLLNNKTLTGIANTKNLVSGLEIYPVPASDILNIRADENIANISIYDITGKLMIEKLDRGSNTSVNISGLNAGIYLVHTQSANGSQVSKIIKN